MNDDSRETCPACGDPMPESCAGPSGRHQPIPAARPAEPTGELREALAEWLHSSGVVHSSAIREWCDCQQIAWEMAAGPLAPLLAKLRAVEDLRERLRIDTTFNQNFGSDFDRALDAS